MIDPTRHRQLEELNMVEHQSHLLVLLQQQR